jgi:CzcA family heavy metal efflux pump
MRWIIGASLRFRLLVVVIAAAMVVVGVSELRGMPVDVFPEFAPPVVEIQTEAVGLTALEVEELLTVPLEEALVGAGDLDVMRSKSVTALSSIQLTFKRGTDILRARQFVEERITNLFGPFGLPKVSKPPFLLPPLSATSRAMVIGLSSDELSLIQMSVLTRWTIKPKLMGVPGVANVAVWGQRERQLQVRVDPGRLRGRRVALDQVVQSTGDALWVSPLSFLKASTPGTGGWIDTPNQRLGVRHVLPISSAADLARVAIEGVPLRLGDVGEVVEAHPPLIGDAVVDGRPGLLLVVEKFPGANTLEVTRGVEEALDSLAPGLPGVEIETSIFRAASFIELSIDNLRRALLVGALLVLVILGALLFEWRAALISFLAIPLSLLAAALVLYLRGETMNVMVLAGLLVALAVVIDDAIVDVENIGRRLRQQRRRGSEKSSAAIVLEASLELRRMLGYATLIVLLAVLPLFFLGGLSGAFIEPLALSYALALLASMLIALTVTPALCLLLLAKAPLQRRRSPLLGWLQRGYALLLARVLQRPRPAFLAAGLGVLGALALWPFLGQSSLLPSFKEPDLRVQWQAAPGTSQPEMSRIIARASRELGTIPGVRHLGAHLGRAVTGDQVVGIDSSQLWASLDPKADQEATLAAIQETVDGYPGLHGDVQTYHQETVREVLTGASDALVVRIYGPQLDVLRQKAAEVKQALSGIDGLHDLRTEPQVDEAHVRITVDLAAAGRHGLKPGDIRRAAAAFVAGITAGSLFEAQKVFDVVVWATPDTRHSLTSLRQLLIDTPAGGHVRLEDVADVRVTPTPTVINREADSRRLDVLANVHGRDLGSVARDVRHRLKNVTFPLEYHPELLGEYNERQATLNRMLLLAAAAAIGILLLLQAASASWRLATLTLATLPPALAGGMLAALAAGGITLGALIGFLAIFAIAARNAITLIGHYQHLQHHENQPLAPPLILRGAQERLTPILLTATTTALALTPLIISGPNAGQEIAQPMAIVILGGLTTTTLTILLLLPPLYLHHATRPEPGKERSA